MAVQDIPAQNYRKVAFRLWGAKTAGTTFNFLGASPGNKDVSLHWDRVTSKMHRIMTDFPFEDVGKRFYLAGGTALALQLGHRPSLDLDYFSQSEDVPTLIEPLRNALKHFKPEVADSAWGNLVFLADGVRIGFYGYGYDLVQPLLIEEGITLANVMDIGLMKLDALLGRAARKDFYDLYFICRQYSLQKLLDVAPRKYPGVRDFEAQVAKRLVYFESADLDEQPILSEQVEWESVKTFFRQQAIEMGRRWIRLN